MNQEKWRRAYSPVPDALEAHVSSTLSGLEEEKKMRKLSLRTAIIAVAIVILLCGVAYALIESKTANLLGWFYGEEKKEELLSGDIAPSGQSRTLGDVVYTLDEVVYHEGGLYGTGSIRPADGANIVLLAEDYAVTDAAGYLLFYGPDEVVPEDAPSYAELAAQKNAKIILAKCVANGVLNEDGSLNASEIGYAFLPQQDGSIHFWFEFEGGAVEDGQMTAAQIDRAQEYLLSLYIANWEVTPEGEWLREAPNDTWLREDWIVNVSTMIENK